MTGTEIAEYEEPQAGTLALRGDQVEWSPVQAAALAHIGIAEAPEGDQQVFMHVAQRTGLDPFAKQIYMIGRKERGQNGKPDGVKWTIQTGIDGFRLIAERHPQYRGQVGPQWCGSDGVWSEVWLDPQKPPAAARVGVLRADRDEPVWGVALFREYAQTMTYNNQSQLTKMWREKGAHMVAKCAEALAIRKAFPTEIGGLHTDDEMRGGAPAGAPPAQVRATAVTAQELTGVIVDQAPEEPAVDEPAEKTPAPGKTGATSAGRAGNGGGPVETSGPPLPGEDGSDQAPAEQPDAEPGDEAPLDPDGPSTTPQNRMMHALFREAQVTDREDRLYLTGLLLDRELNTSKGLSVSDAKAVIDAMERLKASGHDEGLVGAVNDLINAAEQKRIEAEAGAGEDQAAGDESGAES